jgi:hypothetical protein
MTSNEVRWVRAAGAVTRGVEDELFVANPQEGTIHALNPLAAALWRAIETPRSHAELCALFEAAFPGVSADTISGDVGRILQTFEADGLALRARQG